MPDDEHDADDLGMIIERIRALAEQAAELSRQIVGDTEAEHQEAVEEAA